MNKAKKPERKKTPKKITETYLHNSGLYYLQRFSASSSQFRNVMTRKVIKSCHHHKEQDAQICMTLVDALVQKFIQSGLLNDVLYTQGAVSSLRRQGKSKRAIALKLKTRGLTDDLIAEKIRHHDSDEYSDPQKAEITAALIHARKKKFGPFALKIQPDNEKIMASLARAGFSYDIVQNVMTMDRDEAEQILNS